MILSVDLAVAAGGAFPHHYLRFLSFLPAMIVFSFRY